MDLVRRQDISAHVARCAVCGGKRAPGHCSRCTQCHRLYMRKWRVARKAEPRNREIAAVYWHEVHLPFRPMRSIPIVAQMPVR